MIIQFGARISNLEIEIQTARSIVEAIHACGHSLARDWVEPEYYRRTNGGNSARQLDWQAIYQENISAIKRCDAGIFEVTSFGCFGVGFEAAAVLLAKKPVLLLAKAGSQPDGVFATGITDPLVTYVYYDSAADIKKAVSTFLHKVELTRNLQGSSRSW